MIKAHIWSDYKLNPGSHYLQSFQLLFFLSLFIEQRCAGGAAPEEKYCLQYLPVTNDCSNDQRNHCHYPGLQRDPAPGI